jgi:hypothetical protein
LTFINGADPASITASNSTTLDEAIVDGEGEPQDDQAQTQEQLIQQRRLALMAKSKIIAQDIFEDVTHAVRFSIDPHDQSLPLPVITSDRIANLRLMREQAVQSNGPDPFGELLQEIQVATSEVVEAQAQAIDRSADALVQDKQKMVLPMPRLEELKTELAELVKVVPEGTKVQLAKEVYLLAETSKTVTETNTLVTSGDPDAAIQIATLAKELRQLAFWCHVLDLGTSTDEEAAENAELEQLDEAFQNRRLLLQSILNKKQQVRAETSAEAEVGVTGDLDQRPGLDDAQPGDEGAAPDGLKNDLAELGKAGEQAAERLLIKTYQGRPPKT